MEALRLKDYRTKLNMSQREVSAALNITQAYYWKWEKGKSYPNAEQIMMLCDIFHCTPNDLFGFYGDYKTILNNIDNV